MKPVANYKEAEALTGEFEVLPVGGYICKITDVEIAIAQKSGNEMLVIYFDIAEGEKAGYYKRRYDKNVKSNTDVNKVVKWPGVYHQMLDGNDKVAGYLKGLMTTLEASNKGFNWEDCGWDETKLKGLIFGGLFGREEYEKMDGSRGMTTKLRFIRSVEKIRSGNFEVPQDKLLPKKADPFGADTFTKVDDDDLPF